ncbi:MAG: hypothetical protein AB1941_05270 [Gemmatimonadota bacterium]
MRTRIPVLLALLALALAAPLRAQDAGASEYERRQAWFSRDKTYHFGISAAGAGALYAGARRLGLSRRQAALASTLAVGAAGVWREVGTTDRADPLTRRKLSRRDLVWDGAGIALGLAVADRWLGAPRRDPDGPPQLEAVPLPPETRGEAAQAR